MGLRKIAVSTFASVFVLCLMSTAVLANSSEKDEILANMKNTQKIGAVTISDVVSSDVYDWYESSDKSKSAEGKIYYRVDVEKGAYIYYDLHCRFDNVDFARCMPWCNKHTGFGFFQSIDR